MSVRTRLPNWSLIRDREWPVWSDGLLLAVRKALDNLWNLLYADFASRPFVTQSGTLTVTGASATGTLTFPIAEPDTAYQVIVTPVSSTGTPAAGSNRVLAVAKTTTTVTVTVEAQPGGGNSQSFDVSVMRVIV